MSEATPQDTAPEKPGSESGVSTGMGRPDVLDAEKRRTILALLSNGSSRRTAARFVGCAHSTIRRTALRDPEFAAQLARAESSLEVEALRCLRRAAQQERYWRAAAWLLERTNPDEFARREPKTYTADQMCESHEILANCLGREVPDEARKEMVRRLDLLLEEF